MAVYTPIDDPTIYMNPVLYTGNYDTNAITGVGFQPDLVWAKERDGTSSHAVFDAVRGVQKKIMTNSTDVESTETTYLSAFGADGFTLGANNGINESGKLNVAWNWKAGTSFTNDASATGVGDIDSTGSVNTDAGFSIISYTGTGSAGTVAHGLGVAPKFMIFFNLDGGYNWNTYHSAYSPTQSQEFNTTNAAETNGTAMWNDTAPTSSVFSLGDAGSVNESATPIIAYCFTDVAGYSKAGSYIGNSSVDGTFVYTGFRPAWFLLKNYQDNGDNWCLFDNKRNAFNVTNNGLAPNSSEVEFTDVDVDFLSNGVKMRNSTGRHNGNGKTYIYMAFAEAPFVNSNGVPCNAR